MADVAKVDVDEEVAPPKKGKKGLLFGILAMLLLGGGGFFATFSGMISLPFGGGEHAAEAGHGAGASDHDKGAAGGDHADAGVTFVEIPQMTVSLGPSARSRFLRLTASLEVAPGAEAATAKLMPRIKDVINSYLQALDEADVERPAAMARMRAHLLRRIKIVAGDDQVRDLLITEFILQ